MTYTVEIYSESIVTGPYRAVIKRTHPWTGADDSSPQLRDRRTVQNKRAAREYAARYNPERIIDLTRR